MHTYAALDVSNLLPAPCSLLPPPATYLFSCGVGWGGGLRGAGVGGAGVRYPLPRQGGEAEGGARGYDIPLPGFPSPWPISVVPSEFVGW
jgi:hypothetical protein